MRPNRLLARSRHWLVLIAAVPLMQIGACQMTVNQTAAGIANQLPAIVFQSFFDAIFQTLLEALGISTFGGTGSGSGTDDGGFGGGGFGGSGS